VEDPQELARAEQTQPDEKLEKAIFGREVEEFLTNDRIGKYLVERARSESEAAMAERMLADPADVELNRRLQVRFQVAQSVIDWLGEAITDGEQARKILEDEQ
jgi:hypothetical protein